MSGHSIEWKEDRRQKSRQTFSRGVKVKRWQNSMLISLVAFGAAIFGGEEGLLGCRVQRKRSTFPFFNWSGLFFWTQKVPLLAPFQHSLFCLVVNSLLSSTGMRDLTRPDNLLSSFGDEGFNPTTQLIFLLSDEGLYPIKQLIFLSDEGFYPIKHPTFFGDNGPDRTAYFPLRRWRI